MGGRSGGVSVVVVVVVGVGVVVVLAGEGGRWVAGIGTVGGGDGEAAFEDEAREVGEGERGRASFWDMSSVSALWTRVGELDGSVRGPDGEGAKATVVVEEATAAEKGMAVSVEEGMAAVAMAQQAD